MSLTMKSARLRISPVEPARVSEIARANTDSKRTPDGLPVHGFTTLLTNLGTLTLNHASLLGPTGSRFLLASEPTELQAKAFEPLGTDQDRDTSKNATVSLPLNPQLFLTEAEFRVHEVSLGVREVPLEAICLGLSAKTSGHQIVNTNYS